MKVYIVTEIKSNSVVGILGVYSSERIAFEAITKSKRETDYERGKIHLSYMSLNSELPLQQD